MKALVCEKFGPLDELRVVEMPEPVCGPGEVRIRVVAAGLNPPDVLMPQGKYQVRPPLPFVPGTEGAGYVDAIGEGVQDLRVGDPAAVYAGWGALAQILVTPAINVHRVPNGLCLEDAAGFILVYATALHALADCGRLTRGETIVVLGASGGIGLAAIQIARSIGARIVAVASTPEKLALCQANGADLLVQRTEGNLRDKLLEATGGSGADVILDVVGGDVTDSALRAIRPYGRYLIAGYASGIIPQIKANVVLLKQAHLIGVSYRLFRERDPYAGRATVDRLFELWQQGQLHPTITERYPLSRTVEALRRLGAGEVRGKAVVKIPSAE